MKQAENLAKRPAVFNHVALMPDAHQGYGMPIGGVIACGNAVIPAAVGVDIGCGMVATETDIPAERFADMSFRRAFQEKLKERIPVGEGVSHRETQNWEGFEEYTANNGMRANLWPSKLDRMNLGTLGGGNHFIELQKTTALDGGAGRALPDGSRVWLMIHSGSRNLGNRIEEHYHKIANRLCTRFHVPLADPDLAFLPIEEQDAWVLGLMLDLPVELAARCVRGEAEPGELAQLWERADEVFKYGKRSALRPLKIVLARHEMLKKPEA